MISKIGICKGERKYLYERLLKYISGKTIKNYLSEEQCNS